MNKPAALYARVSSDRQKENHTIASQTAALVEYTQTHEYSVPPEWIFQDEGYSGPCWSGQVWKLCANELDQPANQPPQTPALHQYRPSGTVDDVVRVFFLTHAESPQRLQEIATEVRSTTEVRRIFTCTAPRAMTLRGTAAQIAMADQLIAERDR